VISSGVRTFFFVLALGLGSVFAETTNGSASKVMVRGCKAKIVQSADTDSMLPQKREGDSIDKSCKTQEEIDLAEAITAQRKKEAERQRLKFLGLKRPPEDEWREASYQWRVSWR
tara:strand:- start:2240 stop:2584 length:345 start_codon:yes stop_codon:yes gene_type:complete